MLRYAYDLRLLIQFFPTLSIDQLISHPPHLVDMLIYFQDLRLGRH